MPSKFKKTFTDPYYFLALGFGSGLSPKAPGTAGTLMAIPVFLVFSQLGIIATAAIIVLSVVFGIWLCGKVADDMSVKDPASIVFDEFVGMWIAMFVLPLTWYWILIAFLLFRFFDVLKPGPIGWCDKNLEGGAGIMLDDVVAGIFSLLIVQALIFATGIVGV